MMTEWELIKVGNYEEACRMADARARSSSSLLPLHNKIFALLQLSRFADAEQLGRQLIIKEGASEWPFIFTGISLWMQSKFGDAVQTWKHALESDYTDAAGGVEVPLLLWFASVHLNDDRLCTRALRLLAARSYVNVWPGPLAGYITGNVSEVQLRARISPQPILRLRQLCQAYFYTGLMREREGDARGAIAPLRLASQQGPVSLLEAEFYLTKWALGRKSETH